MIRDPNTLPLDDRGPLRVMFVLSSMPVGGAETLLVNLTRRLDRSRFTPLVCCLQTLGPLGEVLAQELPTFSGLIHGKYDAAVAWRLARLFKSERIDAVVTIGAGDKMFWGRIAARLAHVPVVCCAIHSTGWPDVIERPNRWRLLTHWTDAFIAVAANHGEHLVEVEHFPADKVHVIPNGIDLERFAPHDNPLAIRASLHLGGDAPLVGIVAALRPEKNHALFLRSAAAIHERCPRAKFLIIGDGPERASLEWLCRELALSDSVQFLGNRDDVPELLRALDVFLLTSRMEANPVSILEAMACGKPVVAPRVGSISESVIDGETGYLVDPGSENAFAEYTIRLLEDPVLAQRMGEAGRELVTSHGSLDRMVRGYERLLTDIYNQKQVASRQNCRDRSAQEIEPPLVSGAR